MGQFQMTVPELGFAVLRLHGPVERHLRAVQRALQTVSPGALGVGLPVAVAFHTGAAQPVNRSSKLLDDLGSGRTLLGGFALALIMSNQEAPV